MLHLIQMKAEADAKAKAEADAEAAAEAQAYAEAMRPLRELPLHWSDIHVCHIPPRFIEEPVAQVSRCLWVGISSRQNR